MVHYIFIAFGLKNWAYQVLLDFFDIEAKIRRKREVPQYLSWYFTLKLQPISKDNLVMSGTLRLKYEKIKKSHPKLVQCP